VIILGVDPGETTGWCMLELLGHAGMAPILGQLKGRAGTLYALELLLQEADAVAVEGFVVGRRSMRAGAAGGWTRELVGLLPTLASHHGKRCRVRSASEVKPWATDKRLDALRVDYVGLPHAADAARHAIFSAVKDYGRPDPLSRVTSS
jgi:hypothetical protein